MLTVGTVARGADTTSEKQPDAGRVGVVALG